MPSRACLLVWPVIFAGLLVACGGADSSVTPAAEGREPANAAAESASAARSPVSGATLSAGAQSLPLLDLPAISGSLAGLTAYQASLQLTFEGQDQQGHPVTWRLEQRIGYRADPPAVMVAVDFSGDAGSLAPDRVEVVDVDGQGFLAVPGIGCVTGVAGQFGDLKAGWADIEEIIGPITGARLAGTGQAADGSPTQLYVFDNASLVSWAGGPAEVSGQLDIAQEGGFLRRLTMIAQGRRDFLRRGVIQDGRLQLILEVEEGLPPEAVAPPSLCRLDRELPIVQDAFDVASLEELIGYQSRMPFEEVVAFYQEAMPSGGWLLQDEVIVEDSAYMSFVLGERQISINIDDLPEQGTRSILIVSDP